MRSPCPVCHEQQLGVFHYQHALQRPQYRLQGGLGTHAEGVFRGSHHVESKGPGLRVSFSKVILNNVEVSSEYAMKLKTALETEAERLFAESTKELEMIRSCLV